MTILPSPQYDIVLEWWFRSFHAEQARLVMFRGSWKALTDTEWRWAQ